MTEAPLPREDRTRPGFRARRAALLADLRARGRVAVALSGGVDSSVLLHAAHAALGEGAVALVADSASLARSELAAAERVARAIGARLAVLRTDEQDDPRYRANAGDRCYFCKAALFRAMDAYCARAGIAWQAFGEITDDARDDRPGARAARERGVLAPLTAAGFDKRDVRRYAREVGLEVADKPAMACLASRIPVGTPVTAEALARVERVEEALRALGLRQLRVRDHGARARVEVGAGELEHARALGERLARPLREAGFASHELAAYRSPTGA